MGKSPYVLTARIKAKPGCADRYEALVRSTVERLSQYPCFVAFTLHRNRKDPHEFLFYEVWSDQASFEALVPGPVISDYVKGREGLVEPGDHHADWAILMQKASATAKKA